MVVKIGEKIKDLRKKADVTQEKFAEYLGVSAQAVSKWEVEGCYPDLELLAPIANFFSITIDELMGFDKLKEQEEINEYLKRNTEALIIGESKKAVAIMREANAKYPGKFELMKELAHLLYIDALSEIDSENRQNAFKEVISLGEKIRADCRDDKIRREVLKYMCVAYKSIGENEKAINLANANFNTCILESDVVCFTQLLDGEKLIEKRQSNMIEYARCFFGEMITLSKDLKPEYKLAIYKSILDMFYMIFKDGDFLFYNLDMPVYYMGIVDIYMELKDNAKALENIKKAAEYTIAFDQTAFSAPFTSPLVNKIPSVGLRFWKSYKGNQAYVFLKSLNDEKYNLIRDTPEFKEICKNLKENVDENG